MHRYHRRVDDLPWAAMYGMGRRISLDDFRRSCVSLPPPGLHEVHGVVSRAPRRAALLVVAVDVGGEAGLILTKRASTVPNHRGDWVFPGGRVDPELDASSAEAALREAEEEIGIPRGRIELIGQLSSHGPIITGFVIDVFVGVVESAFTLAPDPNEVEEIAILPLSHLMAPERYSEGGSPPPDHDPGPVGSAVRLTRDDEAAPAYGGLRWFAIRDGEDIWGTQGQIVFDLLVHLADTVPVS